MIRFIATRVLLLASDAAAAQQSAIYSSASTLSTRGFRRAAITSRWRSTLALSFALPYLQPIHPVRIDSIIIERFGPKFNAVGGDAFCA